MSGRCSLRFFLASLPMASYSRFMLSVFDEGAFVPCPAPFNLAAHVLAAGTAMPDKIALAVLSTRGSERWSYDKLTRAVRGTARGFLDAGIMAGEIVFLRLGNSVDFPIAYLGAIAAGIVPVPLSAQLTESELTRVDMLLGPRAILRGDDLSCHATTAQVVEEQCFKGWRDLPAAPYDMGDPNRLAYIVMTSGTSGTPRAVGHAHRAIWARQMMMRDWYGLESSDRLLHGGAFNWTFTLGTGLMDPWTMGATALIPAVGTTPGQLPLLLARHDATLVAAAPGLFRQMLKAKIPPLPKLRHALCAGEKLPESLRARWRGVTGREIYEAFGMSECSTFISSAPGRPTTSGALGLPQRGRHVAILDQGQPVPHGTPGEIAIHRDDPGLMLGYLGAEEATAEKYAGAWFCTGDLGSMAQDGKITYLGRLDDMMNAGGYRVSPAEVEAGLAHLPDINQIAVTDVEITSETRIIAAFYTADEALDEDHLKALAAEKLARYKTPRAFIRLPSMPRNANGKILRAELKPYWTPPRKEPEMSLTIPDLTLPGTGGDVTLGTMNTPYVLFFYPRDNTPGCTTQSLDFTALADEFGALGVAVFGVSKDSLASHEKFTAKQALTVPLLSDEQTDLCERMGVWVEKKMYGKTFMGIERSTFLVGADGNVLHEWRKVKVPGHVQEVLFTAKEMTRAQE